MDLSICPLSVRRPRGGPRDARLKLIYLTTGPQGLKGGVGGIYSFDSAPYTSSPRGMIRHSRLGARVPTRYFMSSK